MQNFSLGIYQLIFSCNVVKLIFLVKNGIWLFEFLDMKWLNLWLWRKSYQSIHFLRTCKILYCPTCNSFLEATQQFLKEYLFSICFFFLFYLLLHFVLRWPQDANCYLENYEHVPTIRWLCSVGGTTKRKLFPYHYTVERCQRRFAWKHRNLTLVQ